MDLQCPIKAVTINQSINYFNSRPPSSQLSDYLQSALRDPDREPAVPAPSTRPSSGLPPTPPAPVPLLRALLDRLLLTVSAPTSRPRMRRLAVRGLGLLDAPLHMLEGEEVCGMASRTCPVQFSTGCTLQFFCSLKCYTNVCDAPKSSRLCQSPGLPEKHWSCVLHSGCTTSPHIELTQCTSLCSDCTMPPHGSSTT